MSCWDPSLTGVGSSDALSVALPLVSSGLCNFNVDWGDGVSESINDCSDVDATHTYASSERRWITISGTLEGFSFGETSNAKDPLKLIDVHQWGSIALGNSGGYFSGAANMNFSATDSPSLDGTTNFNSAFQGATAFNSPLNDWDVSDVTSMYGAFNGASSFNQPLNFWDVSHVNQMALMFIDAVAFNQDISSWDVSSVTQMYWMFFRAYAFNNGGQPMAWGSNVSNVTNFTNMFESAHAFNQSINDWSINPTAPVNMAAMFHDATVFNQDLSGWNVSNVTDMSYMFRYASAFNQQLSAWDVSNVTNMEQMFNHAGAFNQPLSAWDVSNVSNFSSMFAGAAMFNQSLSGWNPSNATTFANIFDGTSLSTSNYNSLLNSWAEQGLNPSLTLGAANTAFSSTASSAVENLTTTLGWTLNDLGLVSATASGPTPAFADTRTGEISAPATITLTNNGDIDVTFASPGVTLAGVGAAEFTVTANSCAGTTVSPAASCTVELTFTPVNAGFSTASVIFSPSNGAMEDPEPVSVSVSGTGIASRQSSVVSENDQATVVLTLEGNGGGCTDRIVVGLIGAWVRLPGVDDCSKSGSILTGWRARNSPRVFQPGSSVRLLENNTLTAQWKAELDPGSNEDSPSRPLTGQGKVSTVVWNRDATVVRAGSPAALLGSRPSITIETGRPNRVKPAVILAARQLARSLGGTFSGVVYTAKWRTPRIVGRPGTE